MKKILALIGIVTTMAPVSAFAFPIAEADTLTGVSVTDSFVSGKLDTRLNDLGTNLQTKEFQPIWFKTQLEGIRLHCSRTMHSRKTFSAKCGSAISTR
jgi:hypothetical protein